jgi:hypothetical protein
MPLAASPAGQAGGIIWFQYTNGLNTHAIHMHCAHFSPSPLGTDNDYAYDGSGPKAPSESGVLATFNAFAAIWQTFYDLEWSLILDRVFYNDGGQMRVLPDTPHTAAVVGTYTSSVDLPPMKRQYEYYSTVGNRCRLYLLQHPFDLVDTGRVVFGGSGGLDARDQVMTAYLSGSASGLVAPDGYPLKDRGEVTEWWAHEILPPVTDGGGGSLSTDCIVFPRGAQICNDATEHIKILMPSAEFDLDDTGITLPGGHRLESF